MRLGSHSLRLLSALSASALAYLSSNDQQPLASSLDAIPSREDAPSYRVSLLTLHRDLVNIPSISGSEADVALFLEKCLTRLNFTVTLQPLPRHVSSPARFNVIAWPGRDHIPPTPLHNRVLITSHIDVVPPFLPYALNSTHIPPSQPLNFTTLHPSTLISGRGSVDAKGSVAAQITAITLLLQSGSIPRDSIALLFVVGEEVGGKGMKYFSSSLQHSSPPQKLKAAVFGEPTEGKLACGHKGIASATVVATGKAGHSGYPWLGKSATAVLVRGLGRLLDAELGSSERYGNTTVNVGVIEGGVAANVIAKEARARLAVRVAAGDRRTGAEIVGERMRRVLKEVDSEALTLEVGGGYGPVECECDVDGFETMVANYGTDVPNLEGDHVSYLYGPGSILVAHGDDEGLTIKDLEDAVEGYKRLIKHVVEA
ncbi:Zn-dependent exopeptidase [Parathielavia appendiculata]|uniref:Zn-dependent exopeptidase n=1 Tax=Parathielavia appendiculata TaxID=2587402 RepID=A0AAN6U0T6_9PEZI|nr:Zn-dependent exopeptidase [Parathielavia appendiculata]